MKSKVKVEIPVGVALFYYPLVLIAMMGISMTLTLIGATFEEWFIRLPLAILSLALQLGGLAIAIYMLVILGKSIRKDKK